VSHSRRSNVSVRDFQTSLGGRFESICPRVRPLRRLVDAWDRRMLPPPVNAFKGPSFAGAFGEAKRE
jgi:hypothetical protein